MQNLKVTVVQTSLHWEDKERNLELFNGLLSEIGEASDLIVLPEMFSTAFSMRPEALAEPMDGPGVEWMRQKAKEFGRVVCGSLIIVENGNYFNRLCWMRPDGSHETYDKRHLFRMAREHSHYTAGDRRLIVELNGWRICYDLRFPVWSRNRDDYDCLIYVANWPSRRASHWRNLLVARAIENQAYVIGVNRIGEDGNGVPHSGDSCVVDHMGEVLFSKAEQGVVSTLELDKAALDDWRRKFPASRDADEFEIRG